MSGLVKPFSLIKNESGFKFNIINYFIFSSVTCKYYMYITGYSTVSHNTKLKTVIRNKE